MNNFKYVDKKEFQKIYEDEIVGDRANAVLILTVYFGHGADPKYDRRIEPAKLLHKKMREQFAGRITCPIYVYDILKDGDSDDSICKQFDVNRVHQLPCVILFKDGKMIERYFKAGTYQENIDEIIRQIKKL